MSDDSWGRATVFYIEHFDDWVIPSESARKRGVPQLNDTGMVIANFTNTALVITGLYPRMLRAFEAEIAYHDLGIMRNIEILQMRQVIEGYWDTFVGGWGCPKGEKQSVRAYLQEHYGQRAVDEHRPKLTPRPFEWGWMKTASK